MQTYAYSDFVDYEEYEVYPDILSLVIDKLKRMDEHFRTNTHLGYAHAASGKFRMEYPCGFYVNTPISQEQLLAFNEEAQNIYLKEQEQWAEQFHKEKVLVTGVYNWPRPCKDAVLQDLIKKRSYRKLTIVEFEFDKIIYT